VLGVQAAIEDYQRFLVAQPERSVVREYRPDLPEWQADLLRRDEKWGRSDGRFILLLLRLLFGLLVWGQGSGVNAVGVDR
jgi:hypothetical protein